jgi:hypothetical protein
MLRRAHPALIGTAADASSFPHSAEISLEFRIPVCGNRSGSRIKSKLTDSRGREQESRILPARHLYHQVREKRTCNMETGLDAALLYPSLKFDPQNHLLLFTRSVADPLGQVFESGSSIPFREEQPFCGRAAPCFVEQPHQWVTFKTMT